MTIEEAKNKLREYFEEACKVLGVNCQKISFVYERIGERFRTVNNTCEVDEDCLYINEDWIAGTLRINFLYDLQYQMYHEARHFRNRHRTPPRLCLGRQLGQKDFGRL